MVDLQKIKEICQDSDCDFCPFANEERDSCLLQTIPQFWSVWEIEEALNKYLEESKND